MSIINYNATRTASQFHLDNSFIRLLLGPVGCGKSVANCLEIFKRAAEQEPADDGIRYSRWAVIRSTYPELKATTINTWKDWFPEHVYGKIKQDSPITHLIRVADIQLEVLFLPLSNDDDVKKLKSLELTGIYFNELQYFSEFLFEEATERVNRYPPKKFGCNITWTGVIADTNPPDAQHWIYKRFEVTKPERERIFKYLPAVLKADNLQDQTIESAYSLDGTRYVVNPEADYAHCQQAGDKYWLNLVSSHNDDTINVSYQGNYGIVRKNKRVYPEYNDRIHCNPSIRYSPLLELVLGWDFGRTPAVVAIQLSNMGQMLLLGEKCATDMGLDEFVGEIVIPWLNNRFSDWKKNYVSIGDPAGIAKNQTDETCCFDILKRHGIMTRPAKTNAFTPRREAVSFFLRKIVSGQPAFQIHPDAVVCRQGFNGEYYYNRVQISHDERYREQPEKNAASHPHDALQYPAMYLHQQFDRPKNSAELITPSLIY